MESINFVPPNEAQRLDAIGSLIGIPKNSSLYKILKNAETFHEPKTPPEPNDWLACHKEDGQTFLEYKFGRPLEPGRKVLYINPLNEMDQKFLNNLVSFCNAFFYPFRIKLTKIESLKSLGIEKRKNFGKIQYNAGDILNKLERYVPYDAQSLINITTEDLYPKKEWNFVFGLARYQTRIGVFSFARFNPNFFGDNTENITDIDNFMLYRSCKILAHEASHTFGLRHCIYYQCVMNGMNHQDEFHPLHECPVCLRKLQHALGFDPLIRYKKLEAITKQFGGYFQEESEWYSRVIEAIQKKP